MEYSKLLIVEFSNRFQQLKNEIETELLFWSEDEIPLHCFFGNVINQSGVIYKLLLEEQDKKLIIDLFVFLRKWQIVL